MDRRSFIARCALCALSVPGGKWLLDAQCAQASEVSGTPHWSYSGASGPEKWGSLSTDFSVCGSGSQQSPIDLRDSSAIKSEIGKLQLHYRPVPLRIINNGHTIQVNYNPGSTASLRGTDYALVQFHFHTPSEHTRNGLRYDMELHLVHQNAQQEIAVLAVLLRAGAANTVLDPIWANMPSTVGPEQTITGVSIDATALVPEQETFFAYLGSLTTPPCTEAVRWIVLTAMGSVSAAQIQKFRRIIGMNARPLQSAGQRFLLEQV